MTGEFVWRVGSDRNSPNKQYFNHISPELDWCERLVVVYHPDLNDYRVKAFNTGGGIPAVVQIGRAFLVQRFAFGGTSATMGLTLEEIGRMGLPGVEIPVDFDLENPAGHFYNNVNWEQIYELVLPEIDWAERIEVTISDTGGTLRIYDLMGIPSSFLLGNLQLQRERFIDVDDHKETELSLDQVRQIGIDVE